MKYPEKLALAKAYLEARKAKKPYKPVAGWPLFPLPTKEARSLAEVGR